MSIAAWPSNRRHGFTLIEVIGALVIFSVGVLMVIQVSGALGFRMRYAGVRSELVVLTNERLDSLQSLPFASIVASAGTESDTLAVQGLAYEQTVTVSVITPVLARIDVSLAPVDSVGPTHDLTSYTSAVW